MSKPVSFFSALAVFISVSGTSSFLTHLTLSEVHYSAVYASAKDREGLKSPVANAVFVNDSTMMVMEPTQPYASNATVHGEDIDLGETLILAHDIAAK